VEGKAGLRVHKPTKDSPELRQDLSSYFGVKVQKERKIKIEKADIFVAQLIIVPLKVWKSSNIWEQR
jgi:hypothetical protein